MRFLFTLVFALLVANACGQVSPLATQFLQSLGTIREQAAFPLDDMERFNFRFVPLERKGPTFNQFNEGQKKAGLALLRASLSQVGYDKAVAIMELEKVLIVLEKQPAESRWRDPLNYHFMVFGDPASGTWAWKFEGHHVSYNFAFSDGKLVSSTPTFLGSNPGIVPEGEDKGKQVLKKETDLGFALLHTLTSDQLKVALFSETAPPDIINFNRIRAQKLSPDGLNWKDMTASQQKIFMELLQVFVQNYELGFARTLMEKIQKAGIENLSFAWAGSQQPGAGHYYRIQGPTLLVEYDNTQNNANHVHSVVRDLTNDFAEDILREHYLKNHPR